MKLFPKKYGLVLINYGTDTIQFTGARWRTEKQAAAYAEKTLRWSVNFDQAEIWLCPNGNIDDESSEYLFRMKR